MQRKPSSNGKSSSPSRAHRSGVRGFKISYAPQTDHQAELLRSIKRNIVSFAVGCPGTGKTFLPIAVALEGLLNESYKKVIITRPTIASGPEIGFLPGTEDEKMKPFLVPIYDAIYKLLPAEVADELIDSGKIQIDSISFVRGRNFEDAFVIVDEAENLDRKSFYLLLTRICEGSKLVFCGDSSQIDLHNVRDSGLEDALSKFEHKPDFGVTRFTIEDCRRSRIVREVIKAYFPAEDAPAAPSNGHAYGHDFVFNT